MPFAELYKNIFEKDGPNENSPELLKELVKEYPYFSLAHFYLLQKTPETAVDYEAVAAKTALHFNNPYFLQAQLKSATQKPGKVEILDEAPAASLPIVPEIQKNLPVDVSPDNAILNQDFAAADQPLAGEITSITDQGIITEENRVNFSNDEEAETEERFNEGVSNEVMAESAKDDEKNNTQELNTKPEIEEDPAPVITIENEDTVEMPQPETPGEIHYVPINLPGEEMPEVKSTIITAQIPGNLQEVHTNNEGEDIADDKTSPIQNILSKGLPKQSDNSLLFEPLHATDYFASQGIKLREEAQPADKLGKQLKSFTDWLKTMKKVHDTGNEAHEGNIDLSVQTLAEKSNKEEEVLTEAMADVFIQQGKAGKAREIYQKLSLLNPTKSAYFAAKIDQIK